MKLASPPTNRAPALSAASYKVLGLLRKGCAYRVRDAWRFRGLRCAVKDQTFFSLLEKGLAERVETNRYAQMRITPAGRTIEADIGWAHPLIKS
jgi:hypothetical protein